METASVWCGLFFTSFTFSFAWNLPDRCQKKIDILEFKSVAAAVNVDIVPNIEHLAEEQTRLYNQTYKDYQFIGIPIEKTKSEYGNGFVETLMVTPNNCHFISVPTLIASANCIENSTMCKLVHDETIMDTYTISRGYKWGTKPAVKSVPKKIFEVGGEETTEVTYNCTSAPFKQERMLLECDASVNYIREVFPGGVLKLYSIKTDLLCDFGNVTLKNVLRNGDDSSDSKQDEFTIAERETLVQSALVNHGVYECPSKYLDKPPLCSIIRVDPSKVPDSLMAKLLKVFPKFNPYTDNIWTGAEFHVKVTFHGPIVISHDFSQLVPFTREDGSSTHQYACVFTLTVSEELKKKRKLEKEKREREIQEMNTKIEKAEQRIEVVEKEKENILAEKEKIERVIQGMNTKIEEAEQRMKDMEKEKENILAEKEKSEREIQEMNTKIEKAEQRIKVVEKEKENILAEKEKSEREIQEMITKNEKAEQRIKKVEKEKENILAEKVKIKREKHEMIMKNENSEQRIKEVEKEYILAEKEQSE